MYRAESKNLKISPRKMRLVVDGIRRMPITRALATLELSPKGASEPIKKALMSAIANAVHNGKVEKTDLEIFEMFVNEGLVYKRFHYAGRGRIRPYQKKTSHLKVVLKVKEVKALPAPVVDITTEVRADKKVKGGKA